MKIDNALYYIHEIYQPMDVTGEFSETAYVSLMRVPKAPPNGKENEFDNEFDDSGPILEMRIPELDGIVENSFVRYDKSRGRFEVIDINRDDTDSKTVEYFIHTSESLRNDLINRYTSSSNEVIGKISKVFSYHVNVGHGNFSLVTFLENKKLQVWIIDASEKEPSFLKKCDSKISYRENWKYCFKQIEEDYKCDSFKVSKLFITHSHYDHFSAVVELLKEGYFANDLEVWLNLHYDCNAPAYVRMLSELKKKDRIHFVEPICNNYSHKNIRILAPQERLYSKKILDPSKGNFLQEKNVNNASAVYKITLNGKSIVFPGDIQSSGWDRMKECKFFMGECNYYCISHHGSLNGHTRRTCVCGKKLQNVSECLLPNTICILMGRTGAYSGIYHALVTEAFHPCFLHKTEQAPPCSYPKKGVSFLRIDWQSDILDYYKEQQRIFSCAPTKRNLNPRCYIEMFGL